MDNEKWKEFYASDRSNTAHTFVKIMTSDGKHFFFAVKDFSTWYEIKKYCEDSSLSVSELEFQFRSNLVPIDVSGYDALYLVRAALGSPGMATKLFVTVGILKNGKFVKYKYLWPELILDHESEEDISDCFQEALLYAPEKTKDREK